MAKGITLEEAEKIVKAHGLDCLTINRKEIDLSVEHLKERLDKIKNIKENTFYKYILLLSKEIDPLAFMHSEPLIIRKNKDNWEIFALGTDLLKYITIDPNQKINITFISPINQFENESISVYGFGEGCLELSVYALEKLDLQKGIILNGEKGHSVEELKNGDKYSTEELAKLTRSEKYLAANGINPKTLIVTNTEGKTMSLETYRTNYKIDKYNELLNLLSGSEKRVPVERTNSSEDLQKLLEDSTDPRQKETIKKITNKRTGGKK